MKCREVSKASPLDEVLCKPDEFFAYEDENKHSGDTEDFNEEEKGRCCNKEKYVDRRNPATGMSSSMP